MTWVGGAKQVSFGRLGTNLLATLVGGHIEGVLHSKELEYKVRSSGMPFPEPVRSPVIVG